MRRNHILKRLDEEEDRREKRAKMLGVEAGSPRPYTTRLKKDLRWRYWTQLKADDALKDLGGNDQVRYTSESIKNFYR